MKFSIALNHFQIVKKDIYTNFIFCCLFECKNPLFLFHYFFHFFPIYGTKGENSIPSMLV